VQQVFSSITGLEIDEAVKLVEAMDWGPHASAMFQALVTRWGEIDPAAAMTYALGFTSRRMRNSAVGNALAGWSRENSEAAFDWFLHNWEKDRSAMGSGLGALFQNMAGRDLDWAYGQVWSLPTPGMQRGALDVVLDRMFRDREEPDILKIYEGVEDPAQRIMMAEAIVRRIARHRPQDAAAWVETIADPEARRRATARLVETWGYDRPAEAGRWAVSLPDEKTRYAEMARLVSVWSRDDPTEASAWLNQFPPAEPLDPAVESLVRNTMREDPDGAMDWTESIVNTGKRHALIQEVASEWLRQDYQAALGYILQSELPDPVKKRFLRKAASQAPEKKQ
jgi:hypothetical protein